MPDRHDHTTEDVARSLLGLKEVERMMGAFSGELSKLDEVLEVLAARHMGLRVLGVSCISNLGAGLSKGPLSHEEVQETAGRVRSRFESLLSGVLEAM